MGVSEMLRALWKIERHLRVEAEHREALKKKVVALDPQRAA